MQNTGVPQSLSAADPGQAGIARAGPAVPETRQHQKGSVLPTSGSKSAQLGKGRFGKLSSPLFSITHGEQTYSKSYYTISQRSS